MDSNLGKQVLKAQRDEITYHHIYQGLARHTKDEANRGVLLQIAADELAHYGYLRKLTGRDTAPRRLQAAAYVLLIRLFGLTFGIKLAERAEGAAQRAYRELKKSDPDIDRILAEEERHEEGLIRMVNEERLTYVSSMVLGLNDALVELTGALAGFTLALQRTELIAMVGLVTGIAASMSMAASEYLSTKQEETRKDPFKASLYTGSAYVCAVLFLIAPYLVFSNVFMCLAVAVGNALLVILVFTFYVSVAKELPFGRRFFEMASISLGIAVVNFFLGLAIREVFGVEV
ncbi:MAG: VIT1/CCC1 transporter family protein [bacterium]